jgi:hypothetical protein
MPELPDIPRPSQLWKQLPTERRLQAAEAFWKDKEATVEQAEAIATIAQRIKFRTRSVMSMPIDKKARHLGSLAGVSELVAARLLVAYHLDRHRPMMTTFLDALGIAHEDGVITDEDLKPPSQERLQAAVAAISASYPPEDVSLYLSTLMWQDLETWSGLSKVEKWRSREVEK